MIKLRLPEDKQFNIFFTYFIAPYFEINILTCLQHLQSRSVL